MKLKNNYKKVGNYSYNVVNVELILHQNCYERGIYTRLLSEYRLAYTDDDSLTKFISSIKKNPLKYYKRHFAFNAPVECKVVVNPVSMDNYSFGTISTRRGYVILGEFTELHIHDLYKHNRGYVQYKPNINSL